MTKPLMALVAASSLTFGVGLMASRQNPEIASEPIVGLLGPTPVLGAPFSADATTTIRPLITDGAERSGIAHYFRDGAGRVRVEHKIIGPGTLNSGGPARITVQPEPTTKWVYTLHSSTRTAVRGPRVGVEWTVGGDAAFGVPLDGIRFLVFHRVDHVAPEHARVGARTEELLGRRQISGIETVGRRITVRIAPGEAGNDRPLEIIEERWESPELRMVVYCRASDPKRGGVEYQLTNIRRTEPDPDLFVVPANYRITEGGPWISLIAPGMLKVAERLK